MPSSPESDGHGAGRGCAMRRPEGGKKLSLGSRAWGRGRVGVRACAHYEEALRCERERDLGAREIVPSVGTGA